MCCFPDVRRQFVVQNCKSGVKVVLRRIKIKHGLNNEDRIQLFMETHKKPIKTNAMKIGDLILDIETEFLYSFQCMVWYLKLNLLCLETIQEN